MPIKFLVASYVRNGEVIYNHVYIYMIKFYIAEFVENSYKVYLYMYIHMCVDQIMLNDTINTIITDLYW